MKKLKNSLVIKDQQRELNLLSHNNIKKERVKNQIFARIRRTKKSIYGLHGPNNVAILTQLRLGLSKLMPINLITTF